MKRTIPSLLLILLLVWSVGCDLDDTIKSDDSQTEIPKLVINEFMASNSGSVVDPDEDNNDGDPYEDWFEIYNMDTMAVNIAGYYVTDNLENTMLYQIPATDAEKTTIQPGGFLVIWCDKEMHQGATHVNFALSASGESIGLIMPDGFTIVDAITFTTQTTDISYGRLPDGSNTWEFFPVPTPGSSNSGEAPNLPPVISNIAITPENPTAESVVTISATITDPNGNLDTAWVTYGPEGAVSATKGMRGSGDTYSAEIGTFTNEKIYFFITAKDTENAERKSDTLFFEIGYEAPTLYINEILASNSGIVVDPDEDDNDGDPNEDFVEIYNGGSVAVNIAGYYVTDKFDNLTMYQIPDTDPEKTTIQPGGFLVLWCDREMHQGVLHIDLKLSVSGEAFALVAPNGMTVIDSLSFGVQTTDVSYGRLPDGSNNWEFFTMPTPGAPNSNASANRPPIIEQIAITPDAPTESTPVTISAAVSDPDDNLSAVVLHYGEAGAITNTLAMTLSGDRYAAEIGPFASGATIHVFIVATDTEGASATSETQQFSIGVVGYHIVLNEVYSRGTSGDEDWIEVYNRSSQSIDLSDYRYYDNGGNSGSKPKRAFPAGTSIAANGFIFVRTEGGGEATDFGISSNGEWIWLEAPGGVKIDSVNVVPMEVNQSYGRLPDGTGEWQLLNTLTPGAPNQ